MSETTLEIARQLPTQISELHFAANDLKAEYLNKAAQELLHTSESLNTADPRLLKAELEAQQLHGRKLKFRYTEQVAKSNFIKSMVLDEPPEVNAEIIEELEKSNKQRKDTLKAAKTKLVNTYEEIRQLAEKNETALSRTQSKSAHAAALSRQIVAKRLELTRLRAAYPAPRWTLSAAGVKADEQINELISLNDKQEAVESGLPKLKTRVVEASRELERRREEGKRSRLEREEEEKRTGAGERDERVVSLVEWFSTSVQLHQSILDLESLVEHSENELRVTFFVGPGEVEKKTLSLVFHPGSMRLAEAWILDSNAEISELVNAHVLRNDVPGLIRAVYSRLQGGGICSQ